MQWFVLIAAAALGAFIFLKKPGASSGPDPENTSGGNNNSTSGGTINAAEERRRAYERVMAPIISWLELIKEQYGNLVTININACQNKAIKQSWPNLTDKCNFLLSWYNQGRWIAPADLNIVVAQWERLRDVGWMPYIQRQGGSDCANSTLTAIYALNTTMDRLVGMDDILIEFYATHDVHPEPYWCNDCPGGPAQY